MHARTRTVSMQPKGLTVMKLAQDCLRYIGIILWSLQCGSRLHYTYDKLLSVSVESQCNNVIIQSIKYAVLLGPGD